MGLRERTGPKLKLTPKVIAIIVRHVRAGAHLEEAAAAAGVSRSSLQSWLLQGKQPGESMARRLTEAVDEAQGKHAAAMHGTISRAAKKQWKAAEASLKLSNQSRYGQGRIEFTVSVQLQAALTRLQEEFANEPAIYERILACIAGSDGGGAASSLPAFEGASPATASGPADPSQADAGTVGIPRPQL